MINAYIQTKAEKAAMKVLYDYCATSGLGHTTESPNQEACEQAILLVGLGFGTMDFILCQLDPDDVGYIQWQDIINHLPH